MPQEIRDKVVAITGASSGNGAATEGAETETKIGTQSDCGVAS